LSAAAEGVGSTLPAAPLRELGALDQLTPGQGAGCAIIFEWWIVTVLWVSLSRRSG
jgi:hypothetical protein